MPEPTPADRADGTPAVVAADPSLVDAEDSTGEGPTGGHLPPTRRSAIVALPIGLAVAAAGLVALETSGAVAQAVAVLVGLAIARRGVDAALRRRWPDVDTGVVLAAAWIALVLVGAVTVTFLPLSEYLEPANTLTTPSRLRPDLLSRHPLGTDAQGLDLLGGVVYGARTSLQVSLLAVVVGGAIGGFVGMVAGLYQGRVDRLIGTLTDSLLAYPPLILLLAVVTFLNASVTTIGMALAVVTVPTYVRLARANTLSLVEREFIAAARVQGATNRRIITHELLPNVIRPIVAYSFVIVAVLIVAEASLSYLGVGIARPTPTWGNMIAAGQPQYDRNPHLVFVPGVVMFLTVFALNQIGDWSRRRWDPRGSQL